MKILILFFTLMNIVEASEVYKLTKTGTLWTNIKGEQNGAPCTISYEFEEEDVYKKKRTLSGIADFTSQGVELASLSLKSYELNHTVINGAELFKMSPDDDQTMNIGLDDLKSPKKFIYSFLNDAEDKEEEEPEVINYECQFHAPVN